jgi:hypothetical protein
VQRLAIWSWLKSVGANAFREGVNLTKISMPVQLFEKRSFLERLSSNWDYLDLLMAAANCTDPADRMKYVVGFAISGLCRTMGTDKPFNPILGETYQARYHNGVQVFAEQISHHPPISSWEVVEPHGKVRPAVLADLRAAFPGAAAAAAEMRMRASHASAACLRAPTP